LEVELLNGQSRFTFIRAFGVGKKGDLYGQCLLGGDDSLQGRNDDFLELLLVVELELEVEGHGVLDGIVLNGSILT